MRTWIILLVAALLSPFAGAGVAEANKTVWQSAENPGNKLEIAGDLRYRYEQESETVQSENRNRDRIRIRFGTVYNTGSGIEASWRLATGSNSLHSPHQTLSTGSGSGGNANMGTDKGYIKYTTGDLWLWGGKNTLPFYNQTEAWWDSDINPEGMAIGYKFKGVEFKGTRFILGENGWGTDDTAIGYGLQYSGEMGAKFTLAFTGLSVNEARTGTLLAGDASYNLLAATVKPGNFTLGVDYFWSDVKNERINWGTDSNGATASSFSSIATAGTGAKSSDKNGMVVYAKYKINDMFGARLYYYDMGVASTLELANYAQDDFAYSGNFKGTRAQIDIKPVEGLDIDIRYYNQSTKNKDLNSLYTAGTSMKGSNTDTRWQINLNVAF